jgi:hypothetical protein
MWKTEATAETNGSADAIWAAWQDAAHWNAWHPMIRESGLDGPFVAGSHGWVHPAKGPKGAFVLTDVRSGKGWSSRAKMPGAALDFFYELAPGAAGTRIVMRAEISGPMSPLFGLMIGRQCKEGLPQAVQNLKALAEQAGAPRTV